MPRRMQMVGVIFHERGTLAIGHHFHRAHQSAGFPVAFAAKAVTIVHQALHRKARQLLEAMEYFKGIGKAFEVALFQERA